MRLPLYKKFSFYEMAEALNCSLLEVNQEGSNKQCISGICIDSRNILRGDLFIAIRGEKVDGHSFLEKVYNDGAVAALVAKDYFGPSYGLVLFRVDNVIDSLREMAKTRYKQIKSKVIGVTGTVGKTSSKVFISSLLKHSYRVFETYKNCNTKITVPMNVLSVKGDEDFVILEMGSTEQGDINNHIQLFPPDISVLTSVGLQHVVHFKCGLEGIRKEKASIFSHPRTDIGITDEELLKYEYVKECGSCHKIAFSTKATSKVDYKILQFGNKPVFSIGKEILVSENLKIPNYKPAQINMMIAITTAHQAGMPIEDIEQALPFLKLPENRFEIVSKSGVTFVNDAYNANTESMIAALNSLPKPSFYGKTIALLGQMNEMGDFWKAAHTEVALASVDTVDIMICIGDCFIVMEEIWASVNKPVYRFSSREEAITILKAFVEEGDVVLLKGSNVWQLSKVLEEF